MEEVMNEEEEEPITVDQSDENAFAEIDGTKKNTLINDGLSSPPATRSHAPPRRARRGAISETSPRWCSAPPADGGGHTCGVPSRVGM